MPLDMPAAMPMVPYTGCSMGTNQAFIALIVPQSIPNEPRIKAICICFQQKGSKLLRQPT